MLEQEYEESYEEEESREEEKNGISDEEDLPYGNYETGSNFLPSISDLWREPEDYPQWLKEEFFERFLILPELEIQKPIAIAAILMNSLATPDRIALPSFYCWSNKPGSGKSSFGNYIGAHYGRNFKYIAEFTTAAATRDAVASVSRRRMPACVLFDNFHPNHTVSQLGSFYGVLLKYCRSDSSVEVKDDKGIQARINVHALKIYTSIHRLPRKCRELEDRCLKLVFQPTEKQVESLTDWNLDPLKKTYWNLWRDAKKRSKQIHEILRSLHSNPSLLLSGRRWEMMKMPIVVLTLFGIYSLDEAVELCESFHLWDEERKGSDTDPENLISSLIFRWFAHEYPITTKRNELIGAENVILYSEIISYLKRFDIEISENGNLQKKVSEALSSLGFNIVWIQAGNLSRLAFKES